MPSRRVVWMIVVLCGVAFGVFIWESQHAVIDVIAVPARSSFDPALVEAGAKLAGIGNCHTCHTAAHDPDFAGGRPIPTPFGTIYSSNITPAPGTGIGRWSEAAFARAMRQGISRRGQHLYPAFPYDHFTHLGDSDLNTLYAFLMTRTPVENFTPANKLPFPLNQRWILAFWNTLFLDRTPLHPDTTQSAEWNRGAYLVAALGHCGGCHTPRNLLGAEKTGDALAGGEAEGWVSPALNAASPAPVPWDADHLFAYLRQGWDAEHGAAAGPMQSVVDALARADEADIRAIAVYIASQQSKVSPQRRKRADEASARAAEPAEPSKPGSGEELGAAIFTGACAACHSGAGAMVPPHGIDLTLSSALNEGEPRDAILIVLNGIQAGGERAGPWMPGFDAALTDGQLASLLQYLRAHFGSGPAWTNLEAKVRDARTSKERS